MLISKNINWEYQSFLKRAFVTKLNIVYYQISEPRLSQSTLATLEFFLGNIDFANYNNFISPKQITLPLARMIYILKYSVLPFF